jgi:RNA polymerase subunit RPABC4/transcription elongation factor Spt4
MGQLVKAICNCGFIKDAPVGGGISTYKESATFPFYCRDCGLVNVNIAKGEKICPECESIDVTQYGDSKISIPTDHNKVLEWGSYHSGSRGHLCPNCKSQKMVFNWYGSFD